jgi:hypothetical protein
MSREGKFLKMNHIQPAYANLAHATYHGNQPQNDIFADSLENRCPSFEKCFLAGFPVMYTPATQDTAMHVLQPAAISSIYLSVSPQASGFSYVCPSSQSLTPSMASSSTQRITIHQASHQFPRTAKEPVQVAQRMSTVNDLAQVTPESGNTSTIQVCEKKNRPSDLSGTCGKGINKLQLISQTDIHSDDKDIDYLRQSPIMDL